MGRGFQTLSCESACARGALMAALPLAYLRRSTAQSPLPSIVGCAPIGHSFLKAVRVLSTSPMVLLKQEEGVLCGSAVVSAACT